MEDIIGAVIDVGGIAVDAVSNVLPKTGNDDVFFEERGPLKVTEFLSEIEECELKMSREDFEKVLGTRSKKVRKALNLARNPLPNALTMTDVNLESEESAQLVCFYFRENPNLQSISLQDTNIGGKDFFAKLFSKSLLSQPGRTITYLNLQGNNLTDTFCKYFTIALTASSTNVEHLHLGENKIKDEGAADLAQGMCSNGSVRKLDLSENSIGDAGAVRLAAMLGENSSLQELYLSKNKIKLEGGEAFGEALGLKCEVTLLDLGNNDIRDGATAIITGLQSNQALRELTLHGTKVSDPVLLCSSVSEMLEKNQVLRRLTLIDLGISDESGALLFAGLKANTSLKVLRLSRNSLGDDAGLAIASMLRENSELKKLILSNNNIGCEGITAIADSLKQNQSLETLGVEQNDVKDDGAMAIGEVLKGTENRTLLTLNIGENPISSDAVETHLEYEQSGSTKIDVDATGTENVHANLKGFGVRIANTELITGFSKWMLFFSILTSYFDFGSDLKVCVELSDRMGTWFVFAVTFLVLPAIVQAVYLKSEDELGYPFPWWKRLGLGIASLLQLRILYEGWVSLRKEEVTTNIGTIRLIESVLEAVPQTLLQLHVLLFTRAVGQAEISQTLLVSVAISAVVFSQTMSDLFEKKFIEKHGSQEGFAIFVRLLPCWLYHLCSFVFRFGTLALGSVVFNPLVAAVGAGWIILVRLAIHYEAKSERSWWFVIPAALVANSAWDSALTTSLGIMAHTLEALVVLGALWVPTSWTFFSWALQEDVWASDFDRFNISVTLVVSWAATILLSQFYVLNLHHRNARTKLLGKKDSDTDKGFEVVVASEN